MKPIHAVIAVLVLAAAGAAWFFLGSGREKPPLPPPPTASVTPVPPAAPAGPKFPVPPPPPADQARPLPPLNESDRDATEALAGIVTRADIQRFFHAEGIVRRIVATVDNLPRDHVASRLSPVQPVPGRFAASGQGERFLLDAKNEARYTPLVDLAARVDTRRLVDAYIRFYPLFQAAYVELGYPRGHFNDRLVEVIDHLLDAPDVKGPIELVQPKVLYEFADPELESRSAGQKVLIRVGPGNAAKLKAKLRDLRTELLSRAPAAN